MYESFVGMKAVHYKRVLKKIIQQRRTEKSKTLNQKTHGLQPTKTEKNIFLPDSRFLDFYFILNFYKIWQQKPENIAIQLVWRQEKVLGSEK